MAAVFFVLSGGVAEAQPLTPSPQTRTIYEGAVARCVVETFTYGITGYVTETIWVLVGYDPVYGTPIYQQQTNQVPVYGYTSQGTSRFPASQIMGSTTMDPDGPGPIPPQTITYYVHHLANAMLPGGPNTFFSIGWEVQNPQGVFVPF